jgi:hypothetical protein
MASKNVPRGASTRMVVLAFRKNVQIIFVVEAPNNGPIGRVAGD